ncbi:MAG: AraC family transcriptional regulator [Clostridia bacterium]|nr:AraC family transcriptional regulator [Clostridia bacterium]
MYNCTFSVCNTECLLLNVMTEESVKQKDQKYFEHNHYCFEAHFMLRGEGKFVCGKNVFTALPNQMILIPPRQYHKVFCSANYAKIAVAFNLSAPEKPTEEEKIFAETFLGLDSPQVISCNQEMKELLLKFRQQYGEEETLVQREKVKICANSFIVALFETLCESTNQQKKNLSYVPAQEFVIDDFFALNFALGAGKKELAEKLHVSSRQLHRIMKNKFGKNYREKLTEIRLEIATGFLVDSDKSIAEIAEILGYSTPTNFSTFIKNATGKTPGQIRKEAIK